MGIKLMLNLRLRENYVFCDPNAPLHLSLSEPMGFAQRLTDSIMRGLKAGTIIDVDNVVDMENRKLKDVVNEEEAKALAAEQEAKAIAKAEQEAVAKAEAEALALAEAKAEEVKTEEVKPAAKKKSTAK